MNEERTTELPVRSLADSRLADLFLASGCPVCGSLERATDGYLASLLWENVNDVGVRQRLDQTRGLCPTHVRVLVAVDRRRSGGTLGSGILLGAMLRIRRAELAAANGRGRRRALERSRRSADCIACAEASVTLRTTVGSLARLASEPRWVDALGTADLCLDHLLMLLGALADAPAAVIGARQSERIGALADLLESFTQHSSHDQRHLLTDAELGATDDVRDLLAGRDDR